MATIPDTENAGEVEMEIKPVREHVHIRRLDDLVSPGGIILKEVDREEVQRGEVLAVGSGYLTEDGVVVPLTVQVGDVVLFEPHTGTVHPSESQELVLREDYIIAVLEETP